MGGRLTNETTEDTEDTERWRGNGGKTDGLKRAQRVAELTAEKTAGLKRTPRDAEVRAEERPD
jgi:hypothetical protein